MIDYDKKFARPGGHAISPGELEEIADALPYSSPVVSLSLLSGGFSNVNAAVLFEDGHRALLRYREGASTVLSTELAVMALAAEVVRVPAVLARGECWALLEWIEGQRADVLLEDHGVQGKWAELAALCGEWLARVHSVTMERAGFLGADLAVTEPLSGAGTGIFDYILQCLEHEVVCARLGASRTPLRRFIHEHAGRLRALDGVVTLVHSDYNTKNLLLARDEATGVFVPGAVLDWEFAFAGCPMMDLGNFLRFQDERPPEVSEAFVRAYEARRGAPLHAGWRLDAHLMDLASMLSFMAREHLSRMTERTVLGVIENTLAIYDA